MVGRDADLQRLLAMVAANHRLITVLGPAGVGKTTLLGAVSARADKTLANNLVRVDLVRCTTDGEVAEAVAGRLGATDPGRALAGRGPTVLLLDNFEQVSAHAGLVADWLEGAAELQVIVATRERLRLRGEQVLELGPLDDAGAMALFESRAAAVGSVVADEDRATVTEILELLDGMPLAIELAAARLGLLGPRGLLKRLAPTGGSRDRFAILGGAVRTDTARQATIQGAIDWSWQLLRPAEQNALAQASVFASGFFVEAAEAVIEADEPALLLIQSLRDKSLVFTRAARDLPGELRLGLYQTVRAFAAARLAPELADSARARHTAWALEAGESLAGLVHSHNGAEARAGLALERDNLLEALDRAIDGGDTEVAHRLVLCLEPILATRGPFDRFHGLLDRALALPGGSPGLRSRVLSARGEARRRSGGARAAQRDLDEALTLARDAGDRAAEGLAAAHLGIVCHEQGRMEQAEQHHQAALDLARQVGDARAEGRALGSLAILHHEAFALDTAQVHYEWALARVREAGDTRSEGIFLSNLADLHHESGRHREAKRVYERALKLAREAGDKRVAGIILGNLGAVLHETGRLSQARARREEAATILAGVGDVRNEAVFAGYAGAALHESGLLDRAMDAYDRALERLELAPDPRYLAIFHAYRGVARQEAGLTTDARRDRAEARRHAHPLSDARLDVALSLHEAHEVLDPVAIRVLAASAPTDDSDEVRFALRLLARRIPELLPKAEQADRPTLRVAAEGAGFRAPGAEPVDISRRRTLRGVLERLAAERERRPGAGLSVEDLLESGWPGERVIPEAGANRVYVALATLRKLGLRDVLVSREDGYLLDPETALVRADLRSL